MPGKTLSRKEQRLLDLWRNPQDNLPRPVLRSIEISGGTGLRGLDRVVVPFRYPITAICGPNGAGKSTLLALVALAHHTPAGWYVYWGNSQRRRASGDRSYYIFSDFFVQAPGDLPSRNVEVTWRYFFEGQEVSMHFLKTSRWGSYARRPQREVDYLPLCRILPAQEMAGVRSTFSKTLPNLQSRPLHSESLKLLSYILGRRYHSAEIQESGRFVFSQCRSESIYSRFNMGGGESCVIDLLSTLERMPRGGLLVVEELEACLHPQAQKRICQVLVSVCLKRQIQVVFTTHSTTLLDALPRQSRLLIKRTPQEITIFESPSTRFISYEMTGEFQPELHVYCEDGVAEVIIREAIPEELRLRIQIQSIGDSATVVRQVVCHLRSGNLVKPLCVLDGDCAKRDIKKWIRSEIRDREELVPEYLLLPGQGLPPERWLLEQFSHRPYLEAFAGELGCSVADAERHVEALRVEIDHHDLGYCLHQRINLDPAECIRRTARSVASRHPQLEQLRERIADLLR